MMRVRMMTLVVQESLEAGARVQIEIAREWETAVWVDWDPRTRAPAGQSATAPGSSLREGGGGGAWQSVVQGANILGGDIHKYIHNVQKCRWREGAQFTKTKKIKIENGKKK